MVQPPQIYTSDSIGSLVSKDNRIFTLYVGLDKSLVAQLKQKSLDKTDSDLQENTSDFKRFGEGSYEEWYAKERTPYALVDEHNTLAALAWFGPKPLGRKSLRFLSEKELAEEQHQKKTHWHTIVYRSYKPFRRQGLMTPFLDIVMTDYKKRYPDAKLWAGINIENLASLAVAKKLGFREVPEYIDADAHWCAMVLDN